MVRYQDAAMDLRPNLGKYARLQVAGVGYTFKQEFPINKAKVTTFSSQLKTPSLGPME